MTIKKLRTSTCLNNHLLLLRLMMKTDQVKVYCFRHILILYFSAADSLLSRRSQHHAVPTSNTICLSSAILAGLFGCCAILCGSIAVFFFAALRKHREAFQKNLLKF